MSGGWVSAAAMAFTLVLSTELIGDKLLYSLGALAGQVRAAAALGAAVAALAAKMLAAVLLGDLVASLPSGWTRALSAASFAGVALSILVRRRGRVEKSAGTRGSARAAVGIFAAIFLSEWGDLGQITAATLAARTGAAGAVWCGATAAVTIKAALAMTLGRGARRILPAAVLRGFAVGGSALLAALTALGLWS